MKKLAEATKVLAATIIATMALSFGLCGCSSSQDPIIGEWQSVSSASTKERFEDGGYYTYTNSTISELGVLEGTWEAYDEAPTVTAEGKEWNVYKIESPGLDGDVFYFVSGDDRYGTVGKGSVDTISEKHEFTEMQKNMMHAERAS